MTSGVEVLWEDLMYPSCGWEWVGLCLSRFLMWLSVPFRNKHVSLKSSHFLKRRRQKKLLWLKGRRRKKTAMMMMLNPLQSSDLYLVTNQPVSEEGKLV